MIILDTHMWAWFHTGDSRLSDTVARQIGRETLLSAVSVWELHMLIERGRLTSGSSPAETVGAWLKTAPMRVIPVDQEIAILSRTLPFEHDDPADRFIAATAYRAGVPLATVDSRLTGLNWLKTVS